MSTLKLDTLSNKAGTASVPSDTIVSGTAKAWVNFNGSGVIAIRRSFNVTSLTDNGTGNYSVNFTTAMVDADYCVSTTCSNTGATNGNTMGTIGTATTSLIRVINARAAGALDPTTVHVAIFS